MKNRNNLIPAEYAEKIFKTGFSAKSDWVYVKHNDGRFHPKPRVTTFSKKIIPAYNLWQMLDVICVAEDYFYHRYKKVSERHALKAWKQELVPGRALKKAVADYDARWFGITLLGTLKLAAKELQYAEKSDYKDFIKEVSGIIAERWK